jgi:hypothetical protein
MLGDISNINNNLDLVHILTAVLVVDMVIILIARDTTYFGTTINKWYNKFTITAVILDVLIIMIGFIITRYIFNKFNITFTPEIFIIILLTVQIVHDVLLYKLVIVPYPKGNNQVIDVYKEYADEHGYKIIAADSAMVVASALLAMYLKNQEMHETTSLLIVTLYIIPYFLYQKVKYP